VARTKEKTGGKGSGQRSLGDRGISALFPNIYDWPAQVREFPPSIVKWLRTAGIQQKTGMAMIACSFLAIAGIGAWCGSAPLSGAIDWLAKGLIQSTYAALLALSAWLAVRLRRSFSYLLLLGIAILGVVVCTAAMGIKD
jgi:hypothetical protein